ncbi:hypothetical protein NHQ30_008722 [Ciborinia camelliae]|nr:hypothetical protein NHQ30_008722 [Ciborinia camelliae]
MEKYSSDRRFYSGEKVKRLAKSTNIESATGKTERRSHDQENDGDESSKELNKKASDVDQLVLDLDQKLNVSAAEKTSVEEETYVRETTFQEIFAELNKDQANPWKGRYKSLDISSRVAELDVILSEFDSLVSKASSGKQEKNDEKTIIEQRNACRELLMKAFLWGCEGVIDSAGNEEKSAAQHDFKGEEVVTAVTSVAITTANVTDGATALIPTLCGWCSESLAPEPEVEILSQPTQDSKGRVEWFEYRQEPGDMRHYHVDLYERVQTFDLKKFNQSSKEKTLGTFTVILMMRILAPLS